MEGGLNATIASAMLDMAAVPDGTAHLNAMCGSGTLLAEWLTGGGGGRSVGCDLSAEALACARDNLAAAGVADVVELLAADAAAMPFDGGSFGLITADVPWGDAVGSHASNARLYPAFLEEAARVARDGAVLVVLTHDVRLFERVLERSGLWVADRVERVFHGGHWPRMYRLVRPGGPSAA